MRRAVGIVVAGGVLILTAFTFGTAELLVPGAGFLLLGLGTAVWMFLAARAASVRRHIEDERVIEEQPLEARIEVRGGPLGLPGAEVLDSLAGTSVRLAAAPGRFAGRSTEVRVVCRFPRRGRHRLEAPALVLSDAFGLTRIVRRSRAGAQTVLVLPRTERLRWLGGQNPQRLDPHSGRAHLETLAALEVDGLRPYRLGTPASRISWNALARGAGLLERRLRDERDVGPLVILDLRCHAPREDIDSAVRAAASLTLELARRTGCELLLPGDRRPVQIGSDLGAWPATHARLALAGGGPETPAPWVTAAPRCGAVFYVAAAAKRPPASLVRGAQAGLLLVLPNTVSPAPRALPRFEVSGCRGYRVTDASRMAPREQVA